MSEAPEHVYLLVWWHEHGDAVLAVTTTLERAQERYLEEQYPLVGPRGGKRPPRPVITWTKHDPWTPSGEQGVWEGHLIYRVALDSAAAR